MADAYLEALRSSVNRLRRVTESMTETELIAPAYPTGWSVADVLSHIGSGAVIMQRHLEDALAGQGTPEEFAPGVWDTWNAKSPVERRDNALAADAALLARLEAVSAEERSSFSSAMGPMTFGFEQYTIVTSDPHRGFTVDLTSDAVTLETITSPADPDVELPAEAMPRLVYGRLDRDHSPSEAERPALDVLRHVFPGP